MILIAEDDTDVAVFLKLLIESHEIGECHITPSCADALVLINHYEYRLILLDIRLRGYLSGNDFLREIATKQANIPIIVVTGDPGKFDWSLYPQVRQVIAKPIINQAAFLAVVREQMRLNGHAKGAEHASDDKPFLPWWKRLWARVKP